MRSRSLHRYNQKKPWKWTTGKVVAFVLAGLVIGVLIYLELNINSPATPAGGDAPNIQVTNQEPSFEEQYQEYLKRGRKVIDQNILDSIANLQNQESADPPSDTPPAPDRSTSSNSSGQTQSTVNRDNPANSSNSTTQFRLSDEGEIVEGAPDRESTTTATTEAPTVEQSENDAIEEAFYTAVTVTGTITSSSDGTALSGVNVMVKGTGLSTVTDFNGNYSIRVPGNPDQRTLQFSYRGNSSERIVRPETKTINIRF